MRLCVFSRPARCTPLPSPPSAVLVSEAHKRKTAKTAVAKATEDTLNTIVPPRRWQEGDTEWVQYVSSTPATRMDVINLQEALDARLHQRHAREMGICPNREELYAQTFDELIRQVTVSCAERGLLVLRVRDEIRTNMNCYKNLYESSVAFGMRKALQAEQLRADMESETTELETTNRDLQKQVEELTAQCSLVEQQEVERRKTDAEKHEDEVQQLKKDIGKLTLSLQGLLGQGDLKVKK